MRHIASAAGAVVLALTSVGGVAAAATATVFTGGSVTGSGFGTQQVIVAARGDATAATGRLTLVSGRTRYESSVRCVLVAGNSALVVGASVRMKAAHRKPTFGQRTSAMAVATFAMG